MPNLDSTQVRVAGTGSIWKAPVGTVLPTTSVASLDAAFKNLGYTTDGFTLTPNYKTTQITGWQQLGPLRNITTAFDYKFGFELEQTNVTTLALAFGNATVTPTTGGAYSFVLADPAAEFSLVVDWVDGATSQRFVVPRASLMTLPTIKYVRTDAVRYSLEVQTLVPADGTSQVKAYGVDAAVGGA